MAEVKIKRGTKSEIDNTSIVDGQLLFTTDEINSSLFIDIGTVRKQIGSNADITAKDVQYDNTSSHLTSTNVQDGMDEIVTKHNSSIGGINTSIQNINQVNNTQNEKLNDLESKFADLNARATNLASYDTGVMTKQAGSNQVIGFDGSGQTITLEGGSMWFVNVSLACATNSYDGNKPYIGVGFGKITDPLPSIDYTSGGATFGGGFSILQRRIGDGVRDAINTSIIITPSDTTTYRAFGVCGMNTTGNIQVRMKAYRIMKFPTT